MGHLLKTVNIFITYSILYIVIESNFPVYFLSEQQLGAELGDLRGEVLTAGLRHDDALLPAHAEGVAGNEGIGLIGHVGLQGVHGSGLCPGSLDLDDASGMQRPVDEVLCKAVVRIVLIEFFGNISGHDAGLDLLDRPAVGLTAELHDVAALAFQLAEADGIADGSGVAVDLGG